jgi:hypothetical protein
LATGSTELRRQRVGGSAVGEASRCKSGTLGLTPLDISMMVL